LTIIRGFNGKRLTEENGALATGRLRPKATSGRNSRSRI